MVKMDWDLNFQNNKVSYLDVFYGISERGVRSEDILEVRPFMGRTYKMKLNWTKVEILSSLVGDPNEKKELGAHMGTIVLPQLKGEFPFSFSLELVKGNRYLLKSLSLYPFKINNQLSYLSFVERGDKVLLGSNIFYFYKNKINGEDENHGEDEEVEDFLANEALMKSDLSLLLEGETGSGKSYLAEKIHEKSGRRGNFIQVNLQSFSLSLLESEIFGHRKGSFTGAIYDKIGAIRSAHLGTLFLDELDSLPLEIQTKLLLFLDSKKVRPIGADREEGANVRLIFATATSPESLVSEGRMRKDFYYRILGGHRYKIKPLRENNSKINNLCRLMEKKYDIVISCDLEQFYKSLSWPGNIRQFLAHLKKKIILGKTRKLNYDYLDECLLDQVHSHKNGDFMSKALQVFHDQDGNMSKSSKILNINRKKLARVLSLAN